MSDYTGEERRAGWDGLPDTLREIREDLRAMRRDFTDRLDKLGQGLTDLRISVQEGDLNLDTKLQLHAAQPSHANTTYRLDDIERRLREVEAEQKIEIGRRETEEFHEQSSRWRLGVKLAAAGALATAIGASIQAFVQWLTGTGTKL